MPITSSNFTKALQEGVNRWYQDAYNDHPEEFSKIFDMSPSRKAYEEDVGFSGFGLAPVKAEGASVTYDNATQGYISQYRHLEYAIGFIITQNMVEDDLYDVIGRRDARALARSMRQTKETVAANVLNRAFTSTYVGGDQKELCATDHPNVAGGTWQNELTTAADLSELAIEQACIDIGKWTDDRGLKINVGQKSLIIPVDLQFDADRIVNTSTGQPFTADNTKATLPGKFPGGLIMNHYLTDSDAWFIKTDAMDALRHFERRADGFAADNDFDTSNAKFKATARYSFGWTDPRGIYGSPGA